MWLLFFDFDRIFDDHTIQVKKEFVDVAFILRKRAENEERLREAEQRKKEAEERVQATVVTENGSDGQKRESDAVADETPPEKRAKVRGKKERGQNKNRGQHFEDKLDDKQKICRAYMKGECDRAESECKWSHDEMSIYNNREQDLGLVLGMSCPTYEKYGYCHYGISCRFCDSHITLKDGKLENHKHPTVEHRRIDYYESNRVNGTFLSMLRSNRYAFSKTVASLKELPKNLQPKQMSKTIRKGRHGHYAPDEIPKECYASKNAEKLGAVADGEKKTLDFRGKSYLAPLTTVGNMPFRRVCKDYGVDITCGEMATCRNLVMGKMSEWALVQRHASEDFFGVQIAGSWPDELCKTAELISEFCDVDFIDINCGCPLDLICKTGGGCRLGKAPDKLAGCISSMKATSGLPVTCKIRTGWEPEHDMAHKLIAKLKEAQPALITLHGRSRICRYTGVARWDYINKCSEVAKEIDVPFFGNGDVLSYSDYAEAIEKYGTDGAMIGRGALIKPWVFEEIKEKKVMDPSSSERMDMLKKFVRYGLEHWGTDQQGIANTRRFLLEWLSFLCRYVPTGIIEGQPQKINHRPPPLVCRDELETLFTSSDCNDWIKITEMLLGPVPESFRFVPKHKANAYKK